MPGIITYNGVPLLSPTQELIDWAAKTIPPANSYELDVSSWWGPAYIPSHYHVPHPPTAIRLGTLYWPNTAGKYAVYHGLIARQDLDTLRRSSGDNLIGRYPLTLTDEQGNTVTVRLWCLLPRPLSQFSTDYDDLYLLTLVDSRYFLWQHNLGPVVVDEGNTTWDELYGIVDTECSIIQVQRDPIPGAYGMPGKALLTQYQPSAGFLDYASTLTGLRVAAEFDGRTIYAMDSGTARDRYTLNKQLGTRNGGKYDERAGGEFKAPYLVDVIPETCVTTFPNYNRNTTTGKEKFLSTFTGIEIGVGGRNGTKVYQSSTRAMHLDGAGVPINLGEMTAIANAVAQDIVDFDLARMDVVYNGIVPFVPDAVSGGFEWTITDDDCYSRHFRGEWPHDPELIHIYADEGTAGYINNYSTSFFKEVFFESNVTFNGDVEFNEVTVLFFDSTVNFTDGTTINLVNSTLNVTNNSTINITNSTFNFTTTNVTINSGDWNFYGGDFIITPTLVTFNIDVTITGGTWTFENTVNLTDGTWTVSNTFNFTNATVTFTTTTVNILSGTWTFNNTINFTNATVNFSSSTVNINSGEWNCGVVVVNFDGTIITFTDSDIVYNNTYNTYQDNSVIELSGGAKIICPATPPGISPGGKIIIPQITTYEIPTYTGEDGEIVCGKKYFFQYRDTTWTTYVPFRVPPNGGFVPITRPDPDLVPLNVPVLDEVPLLQYDDEFNPQVIIGEGDNVPDVVCIIRPSEDPEYTPLLVEGVELQEADLSIWRGESGVVFFSINENGYAIIEKTEEPTCEEMPVSSITFMVDDTPGDPKLIFTAKDSAGVCFTKVVCTEPCGGGDEDQHTETSDQVVLGESYDITSDNVWEDTGFEIEIPTTGRYLITGRCAVQAAVYAGEPGVVFCKLYNDTAAADLSGSEAEVVSAQVSSGAPPAAWGDYPINDQVDIGTAPATIKIYAKRNTGPTWHTSQITRGVLGYIKLSELP